MSFIRKIKVMIVKKLMNSMGLQGADERLVALEFRAPIADARMDHINHIFERMDAVVTGLKRSNKISDLHFQSLYNRIDGDARKLSILMTDFEANQIAVEEKLLARIDAFEANQNTVEEKLLARMDEEKSNYQSDMNTLLARIEENYTNHHTEEIKLRAYTDEISAIHHTAAEMISTNLEKVNKEHQATKDRLVKFIDETDERHIATIKIQDKLNEIYDHLAKVRSRLTEDNTLHITDKESLDTIHDQLEHIEKIEILNGRVNLIRMLLFETVAGQNETYISFSDLEN